MADLGKMNELPDRRRTGSTTNRVYPANLPPIVYEPKLDEFGFTQAEKKALTQGWTILRRSLRKVALRIYLDLFTEHEMLYEGFRWDGKLDTNTANRHPKLVLSAYERIFNTIDHPCTVRIMLKYVTNAHKRRGVTHTNWSLYTHAVKSEILSSLQRYESETFKSAVFKLTILISGMFTD